MIGRRGTSSRRSRSGEMGGIIAMTALVAAAALAWYEAPSGTPPRVLRDLCGHLPRYRDRSPARLPPGPRRRGVGRRKSHAGGRRGGYRRYLPRHRFRHSRASPRHDDRRRQSAAVGILSPRHRLDRSACPAPVGTARNHYTDLRLVFRFSAERRDLPRHDAARRRYRAAARAQSDPVSVSRRNGRQYRQRCDDHGESAKHSDRRLLAYSLQRVRGGPGAGGRGRAAGDNGADCGLLSERVLQLYDLAAGIGAPAACAPPSRDQIGAGRRSDDGSVFCRAAARESRADRGRIHAVDPHRAQRADLPRDRLALLLMFAGLFVVVAGFEKALLTPEVIDGIGRAGLGDTGVLSAVTAVLSNLVSNVPAVLVLRPFVGQTGDPQHAWLFVAMASTLAGNLTVLGSVANLIVVQLARAEGVTIGFWEYFRVGAPLTVLTILLGLWWLSVGGP